MKYKVISFAAVVGSVCVTANLYAEAPALSAESKEKLLQAQKNHKVDPNNPYAMCAKGNPEMKQFTFRSWEGGGCGLTSRAD